MSSKDSACRYSDDANSRPTRVKLVFVSIPLLLTVCAILAILGVGSSYNHASAAVYGYSQSYYFPSYDNSSPDIFSDTILVSNLGNADTTAQISIGGNVVQTETVSPETEVDWQAATPTKGGIVQVTSMNGQPLQVSQRTIRNNENGKLCDQLYAVSANNLDTQYYFSWYDSKSYNSDIEIGNVGTQAASVNVYIAENLQGTYTIAPNSTLAEQYPGIATGPVRVVSLNSQPLVVSKKVYDPINLSEINGTPVNQMTNDYSWTKYDAFSGDYYQLYIANISSNQNLYYEVDVGGQVIASDSWGTGPILPGHVRIPPANNVMGGPARLRTWSDSAHTIPMNVVASETTYINGNQFVEIQGTPTANLGSTVYLSKHNDSSSIFPTSLIIANAGNQDSTIDVYVGNNPTPIITLPYWHKTEGDCPLQIASNGPVRVVSRQGQPTIAEQIFTYSPKKYDFPWYDNVNGYTWLLMSQPNGSTSNHFNANLGYKKLDSGLFVPSASTLTKLYNDEGGPVTVTATDADGSLVSERSLFGGSSFEEVWGSKYDNLDWHYYWPDYMDGQDFSEWILVSNPPENIYGAHIYLHITTLPTTPNGPKPPDINAQYVIQPGQTWTPSFPNTIGMAVEIKSYLDGNPGSQMPVIASERILIAGKVFNEMPGIGASSLKNDYLWTWYDAVNSDDGDDVIAVGNPNSQQVWITAKIAGVIRVQGWINPGNVGYWQDSTKKLMGGPVEVTGCFDQACTQPAPVYTSQQTLYGPSYEEIAGTPTSSLKPTSNWTWYDQQSAGSQNWILVANPNAYSIYYEISMPDVDPAKTPGASGVIQPGQKVTPQFNGVKGGPVRVSAWTDSSKTTPANVMASQRVLWNGFFNEVVGLGM